MSTIAGDPDDIPDPRYGFMVRVTVSGLHCPRRTERTSNKLCENLQINAT